jgi:hypothetical protein
MAANGQQALNLPDAAPESLTAAERRIWTALADGPSRDVDGLAAEVDVSSLECAQILQGWILRGWARRDLSGSYSMVSGALAAKN